MNNHPEIHLKLNAKFVRTCEVPALIANALYPEAHYLELPVIDLYKTKKPNIEPKKHRVFNFLSRKSSTSKPVDNWYEPLNQLDEDMLRKNIWLHLPELKFPISIDDWHQYGEAFANWESEINFELKPDRVEWTYEPKGDGNSFYKLNRDTRNKLGIFEDELVSDENIAIQECGIAEFNHIGLLRNAIQCGKIEQLDPNSNIPTETYLPYGRITIAALTEYVKQFKLSVNNIETEPVYSTTVEAAPVDLSHTQKTPSSSANPESPPQSGPKINAETTTPSNDADWCVQARAIADQCFDHDTQMKCRDSLKGYSGRVMDIMQKRNIKGPRGIIDNHATIMREALQSKKWWANKAK